MIFVNFQFPTPNSQQSKGTLYADRVAGRLAHEGSVPRSECFGSWELEVGS
jgi:hypothetical protein